MMVVIQRQVAFARRCHRIADVAQSPIVMRNLARAGQCFLSSHKRRRLVLDTSRSSTQGPGRIADHAGRFRRSI